MSLSSQMSSIESKETIVFLHSYLDTNIQYDVCNVDSSIFVLTFKIALF